MFSRSELFGRKEQEKQHCATAVIPLSNPSVCCMECSDLQCTEGGRQRLQQASWLGN